MRDILVTAIVLGSLPIILRRPWVGIIMFSWLSYMNPHRLAWGFAYDMPFAAMVGATTIIAMFFYRETRGLPLKPIMFVWFFWILWMCVTTPFAIEQEGAAWEWERSMKIQLMALLSIMLLQDRQKLNALIWIIVISIGFYGVKGGLFAVLTGGSYRVWGPPNTFFEGTNPLALTILMTLPLVFYLYRHTAQRWLKFTLAVSGALCFLAALSTYSRGAFVTIAALGAYMLYKSRQRILLLPIILCSVIGAAVFMPEEYYDRIASIQEYDQEESAMGRIRAWIVSYNVALDRPLVGGGFQMMSADLFEKYQPGFKPHDVHSVYFEALGEQGFVGFFLFITLMWLAFREGKTIRQMSRGDPEKLWAYDLATSLQMSIVAYAVGGAFLGLAYFDLYYHLIAILVLTRICLVRESSEQSAEYQEPAGLSGAPNVQVVR